MSIYEIESEAGMCKIEEVLSSAPYSTLLRLSFDLGDLGDLIS